LGGQPTLAAGNLNIPAVARACGYELVLEATASSNLEEKMSMLKTAKGPAMLEIIVEKGARSNLGRPTTTPKENKEAFMKFLQE